MADESKSPGFELADIVIKIVTVFVAYCVADTGFRTLASQNQQFEARFQEDRKNQAELRQQDVLQRQKDYSLKFYQEQSWRSSQFSSRACCKEFMPRQAVMAAPSAATTCPALDRFHWNNCFCRLVLPPRLLALQAESTEHNQAAIDPLAARIHGATRKCEKTIVATGIR